MFGFSIEVGLLGLPSTTLGTGFSPNKIEHKKKPEQNCSGFLLKLAY